MDRDTLVPVIIGAVIVFGICCICSLVLFVIGGAASIFAISGSETGIPPIGEVATVGPAPTLSIPTQGGTPVPVARDTLETLENTIVPINDPRDLALRLEGKRDLPVTLPPPPQPLQIGAQDRFWVTDTDTDENFQIDATLQYVTDHGYFWVENGVSYRASDLEALALAFENQIYPTTRAFFGSEWTPGVDGDPHIYILYTSGLGFGVAGYYSSNDQYPPAVLDDSNGHEMFVFNADTTRLDEEFTYGVLAHEFQHMIHWYVDSNETSWLNEGMAELAQFLNGYTTGFADEWYVDNPDLQLNDWPNDPDATLPHYGAGFLFTAYFLDRFGAELTQALVAHPANGLTSVDLVLTENNVTDPQTGQQIRADDLYMDWVVANYLQDDRVADGRYDYSNYPDAPDPDATERINACPLTNQTRDVRQYGVDYVFIDCIGSHTFRFEGSTSVEVIPADAHSGSYAFWSNKGDTSDMTLTRTFDFTGHDGPLTFSYWTWYDIEEDWDYLYVLASTNGETWDMLTTPSGTDTSPTGQNYGWAYTGLSGGDSRWIQESVDISAYAGQEVQLRFEYITDAAVNGEGLLVDDIAIEEIGYFTDFEAGDGGWEANGFARIENSLPQSFRLALITLGNGIDVQYFTPDEYNILEIPLDFGSDLDQAVVIVSGTTRYTRQPATYRFSIGS